MRSAISSATTEQLAATLAPIFCESIVGHRPRIAPLPDNGNGGPSALDKLSWRREYMSHEQRFVLPYNHAIEKQTLVLEQTAFGPEGFASTIWDSAIVLARYLEHRQSSSCHSCVELGAGCGLPGIVLHALGAKAVLLTDLEDNLPLLQRNMDANCSHDGRARVEALRWGFPLPAQIECGAPYDLIVATDVLYVLEAVVPLVETLVALSNEKTEILIAAGRNRQHGDDFFAAAARDASRWWRLLRRSSTQPTNAPMLEYGGSHCLMGRRHWATWQEAAAAAVTTRA